ncbi:MAG TPA: ThuA domain-containing protein [Thermoanaerobaculia bacterium]|nr:ThuA domain-containing protein [Thermoanaerobaculia bacterium]
MRSGAEVLALALAAALVTSGQPAEAIVVTATEGYRHESIETAEGIIVALAQRTGAFTPRFVRKQEELSSALTPEALAATKLVMFVNTTGELEWPERQRLLDWIAAGGSFLGAHSASDTWHQWPGYLEMLGGEFESHPEEMTAEVIVTDRVHPAGSGLLSPHPLFEEFYQFKNFAREKVTLVLTLADGSPMAWYRPYGKGRVFYTALGHRHDVWNSPWFQQHLTGAILWSLGHEQSRRRRAVSR